MSEALINIELGLSTPDEWWRYQFGEWTQHPRLEGETDAQLMARIKSEADQALGAMLFECDNGTIEHTADQGLTYSSTRRLPGETDEQVLARLQAEP